MFRALIVGCGNIAGGYDLRAKKNEVWSHAKAFQLISEVKLEGVVDVSEQKAAEFARTWKIPHHGMDLARAIKKIKPDIVSICSPTSTHLPIIRKLCRSRVPAIICEKPLAYTLADSKEAIHLCQRNNILLAVNYQRNWNQELRELGEKLRTRKLGAVHLVRVLYSKGLIHNGSHFISMLLSWFHDLKLEKVLYAQRRDRRDVDADFLISSPFVPRILFQSIPETAYVLNELECFCDDGRLQLKRGGLEIHWTEKSHNPLIPTDSVLKKNFIDLHGTLSRTMLEVIRNVVATLAGKEPLACPPENAVQTLQLCEKVSKLAC